jgi:hypothetical protein
MASNRLIHFQQRLNNLYSQLADLETALDLAVLGDKERHRQLIRLKKEEIEPVEKDYWLLLRAEASTLTVSEIDAEVITATIIQEAEILEAKAVYPDKAMQILREILTELKKPGKPTAGKLKAVIPLLPGFVAYEMELDTEGLLRRLFPTFLRLLGK